MNKTEENKPQEKIQPISFRRGEIVTIKGVKVQILKLTNNSMSLKFLGDKSRIKVVG